MIAEHGESLLSFSSIVRAVLTYCVVATIYHFWTTPRLPENIPWQGYGKGWIAGFRNYFALSKSRAWVLEGYEKYNKKDKMFALPSAVGMAAEIVVPQSQISWMLEQPDSVLSTSEAHYDFLQGPYSWVTADILKDPYHEHVIHKNLVRNLNTVIPGIAEEVPEVVRRVFRDDTENSIKVELLDGFMRMIPRLTNRLLVGPALAREQKYLDAAAAFTMDAVKNQTIIPLFPKALRPIIGNIMGCFSKYHYWQASRYTLPLIRRRIEDMQKKNAGDPAYKSWVEPSDYITWHYRTAIAEGRLDEAKPEQIAIRIMPLNFAANHTTALTAYHAFSSILSSDPIVVEKLREEAYQIFQQDGGWTRAGLGKMYRMDSAIRESQRTCPISVTFVGRKVIAKEGITTPDGVHIECGSIVSCPWSPMAHDEEYTVNPKQYDAFRYSRPLEEYNAMSPEEKEKVDALKLKSTGLVTSSDKHLPFGHGRHACPGRFFVAPELKMMFADMLLNYDFQPLEKPEPKWLIRFMIPTPIEVEAKRRKTPWQPA